MKTVPYKEGTWFAVPLEKGGYAVGVVARCAPKGPIVLAYLFGPKRDHVPLLGDLVPLKADEALAVWRVGDLGLINGAWPIIGESPTWNRTKWPTPEFTRIDELTKSVAWRVHYADDDPSVAVSKERIPYDRCLPDIVVLHGAQAAEIALSRMLDA